MFTARPQKNLKQAKTYFREHLAHDDYYSESQKVQGEWFGKGAERLGLDLIQSVSEAAFVRLCDNQQPLSGEPLTVRQKKDRRVFYDFVVAPPKSVSVMAETMADERIVQAHRASARVAFREMEKVAAVRVRQGGVVAERMTSEVVAACFEHDASRSLDPQLHTHFVVFNATYDPVERRWKALETRRMFEALNFFTEVYRSELAVRLQALGYHLRPTTTGFEIEGVSDVILQRFSKRRRAILAEATRLEQELGKVVTNNGRAAIAHAIRERKLTHLSAAEVRAFQRAQLSEEELAKLESLKVPPPAEPPRRVMEQRVLRRSDGSESAAMSMQAPDAFTPGGAARAAIDFARDHLFERKSVVSRRELLSVALKHGLGLVRLPELEAELGRRTEFLVQGQELATKAGLQEEQRLIALVNTGIGRCRPLAPARKPDAALSAEQQQALQSLLRSPDQVVSLRGTAGTGKTQVVRALVNAVRECHELVLLAPTKSAVKAMHEIGLTAAETVQSFKARATPASCRPALIVDEAGLLSLRQMLWLVEHVHRHGGRLVLVGDTRQHTSIEAGDALRVLERHSALRTVPLHQIQRQTNAEYRQVVADLAAGERLRGVGRLEKLGAVIALPDERRLARAAEEYVASLQAGKSALVICPTWREIDSLNEDIRTRLQAAGLVSRKERTLTAHRSLKWTKAQKRNLSGYQPGLVLNFHKGTKSFTAGDSAEVLEVERQRLIVRRGKHGQAVITGKQSDCFDVAKVLPLAVAPGDRLLIQGNRKRAGLLNGQMVTVKDVRRDGSIRLANGGEIPADFRQFTHGYASTSQAAQGRTVDHVTVVMDQHSAIAANAKQFYVSVSRGRERVRIFTDHPDTVRHAVARPGTRPSAIEMLQAARLRKANEPNERRSLKAAV